ncbi:unnamed protein product [Adineta ricciae]|uniref:DnaJ homolog subfamily B member 9 n=1 Tax=Adineta ricciae TaxID=249248 RepID=A0A815UYR5_ADIRI|nr:unnamed protein product [Adineta ricciae]
MQVRNMNMCTQWLFLLVLIACVVQSVAKDYYQILGVKPNASEREIKRHFHKLALKYHPDKNKDPKAATMFQTITEAYDVLSDPDKRQLYDSQGHESFQSYRKYGDNGFSKFAFDTNKILKEFDESLVGIKRQFQNLFDQTSQHRSNFDSILKNHRQTNKDFDFNNLFTEGLNMLKANLRDRNNQQHCRRTWNNECI